MNKKFAGSVLVSVALAVLITGVFHNINKSGQNDTLGVVSETLEFSDSITGMKFNYPSTLKNQSLSEKDIKDKFIGRLLSDSPSVLLSIRYEEGLASVSKLTNTDPLTLVSSNAAKALPLNYPNYKETSSKELIISSKSAREMVFDYNGTDGSRVTQKRVFIQVDSNTVIYLALQSSISDYETAEKLLTRITDSISF